MQETPTPQEESQGNDTASKVADLLMAARREVMATFGAEYGPRVAPFVTSIRKAKEACGCDAFGVFGLLNHTGWAAMFHPTCKALLLAALHDEVRYEARQERKMVIVP